MISKQFAANCEKVRVVFELPSCLWADRIYVVGDFNEWQPAETPLKQDRDGVWRAELELPVGHYYEFRYLIDGKWHAEIHADGSQPSDIGCNNSVLDTTMHAVAATARTPHLPSQHARRAQTPASLPLVIRNNNPAA